MADLAPPRLTFDGGCPDPGRREIRLPAALPDVGDDFDWDQRDYDGFRNAMIEELQVRFPERRRFSVADVEVVLVEAFAAVLDQLSDMDDRVSTEAYLETARRPESVYRWLRFIGVELEAATGQTKEQILVSWRDNPHEMELARRAGPGSIRAQHRMASLSDYDQRLEEHPLVRRARAVRAFGGSWVEVHVTLDLFDDLPLDTPVVTGSPERPRLPANLRAQIERFHRERNLLPPVWTAGGTLRDVLELYVGAYRSIGQDVSLFDVAPVGLDLAFCVELAPNYFQSEVGREVRRILGRGPGGFFEPGRLRFGEDIRAGDLYERLMGIDGVLNVELLTLKRVGSLYLNQAAAGSIVLDADELAVCDSDPTRRERGLLQIKMHGGRRG